MKKISQTTKTNIINAFWILYKNHKIETISIQQIMQIAGYHRSTFYLYFNDIYDLLDCIENNVIEGITFHMNQLPNITSNDISEELIHKISHIYQIYGEYLFVLLGENGDGKFLNKLKETLKPLFYKELNPHMNTIYYDLFFEFSISALIGSLQYYYHHKDELKIEEVIYLTRSMLTQGIFQYIKNSS